MAARLPDHRDKMMTNPLPVLCVSRQIAHEDSLFVEDSQDPNQAWKSLGERLFQKLTNATPITSIPPDSKPRARQASSINADARTDRPRASVISVNPGESRFVMASFYLPGREPGARCDAHGLSPFYSGPVINPSTSA
jgi:hypothetical protein